jgi:hypothetical protein
VTLLYGIAAVILVWYFSKLFAGADPKKLVRLGKVVGGTAALAVAGLMMLRGRLDMAIFMGGLGAWLFGWSAGVLRREGLATDPDGARLLEAYLDRRAPGWREDADRHRDPGQGRAPGAGAMTDQEAYEILGLQPGAGEEAVREAHRALMKRIHPDAGGTSGLAARVNQAKDTLLKKHG